MLGLVNQHDKESVAFKVGNKLESKRESRFILEVPFTCFLFCFVKFIRQRKSRKWLLLGDRWRQSGEMWMSPCGVNPERKGRRWRRRLERRGQVSGPPSTEDNVQEPKCPVLSSAVSGEKITHPSQEIKWLFNFTQAFTWKLLNSFSAFFALPKRSGENQYGCVSLNRSRQNFPFPLLHLATLLNKRRVWVWWMG